MLFKVLNWKEFVKLLFAYILGHNLNSATQHMNMCTVVFPSFPPSILLYSCVMLNFLSPLVFHIYYLLPFLIFQIHLTKFLYLSPCRLQTLQCRHWFTFFSYQMTFKYSDRSTYPPLNPSLDSNYIVMKVRDSSIHVTYHYITLGT